MIVKSAQFVVSSTNKANLFKSDYPQVAFVGRSNVGKSSLINFITSRKKLAKTSATPGKTKLINYFLINEKFLLVDLPGYGFANVNKQQMQDWGSGIEDFLKDNKNLKCVYVLLDIRRLPTKQDEQMINFLYCYHIPFVLVVTKTDTLSRAQVYNQLYLIAEKLKVTRNDFIITSSEDKKGLDDLLNSIEERIEN